MGDLSNVIQFSDLKIARIKDDYIRRREGCQHRYIEMDDVGEVVKCVDCGSQVSAYWALNMFTSSWGEQIKKVQRELDTAKQATALTLHLRAAKQAESVWRGNKMLPTCPHCARGIMLEDNFGGATVNKAFEQGLRVREAAEAKEKGLTYVPKLAPGKPKPAKATPKTRSKVKPAPKWEDAPAWAQWLTQAPNGKWTWHVVEPFLIEAATPIFDSGGQQAFAGTSPAPADGAPIKQKRPTAAPQGTQQ
jgi:hypothetical protein